MPIIRLLSSSPLKVTRPTERARAKEAEEGARKEGVAPGAPQGSSSVFSDPIKSQVSLERLSINGSEAGGPPLYMQSGERVGGRGPWASPCFTAFGRRHRSRGPCPSHRFPLSAFCRDFVSPSPRHKNFIELYCNYLLLLQSGECIETRFTFKKLKR